jgi:hypothetical protein
MTKPNPPGASRARAVTDPSFLTLAWLLDEMIKGGLIAAAARKELIELPPRKDGVKHHPLVVAHRDENSPWKC